MIVGGIDLVKEIWIMVGPVVGIVIHHFFTYYSSWLRRLRR